MVIVNSPTVDQAQSEAKHLHKENKQVVSENSISQGNCFILLNYISKENYMFQQCYYIMQCSMIIIKKKGKPWKIKFEQKNSKKIWAYCSKFFIASSLEKNNNQRLANSTFQQPTATSQALLCYFTMPPKAMILDVFIIPKYCRYYQKKIPMQFKCNFLIQQEMNFMLLKAAFHLFTRTGHSIWLFRGLK